MVSHKCRGRLCLRFVNLGQRHDGDTDLSGAAAWALQDYLAKGYGFMIGHDMMYHYGGVAGEGYVPDPNDTTTPYYQLNTDMAGSWNMNWLMGQNEMYDVANPYDAASMILCCGNWHDKNAAVRR